VPNANGNREIVESVQDNPVPTTPTAPTTTSISVPRRAGRSIDQDDLIASIDRVTDTLAECLSLVNSVLDRSTISGQASALQSHHAAVAERSARARLLRWQDSDLVITAALEGRMGQHRPLPATGLRLADYEASEENVPRPYPFGWRVRVPFTRTRCTIASSIRWSMITSTTSS